MSKFFTAAALSALIATGASAGGMQPVIEMVPDVVMDDTGSSSSNLIVPLIIVALIAAAAS